MLLSVCELKYVSMNCIVYQPISNTTN